MEEIGKFSSLLSDLSTKQMAISVYDKPHETQKHQGLLRVFTVMDILHSDILFSYTLDDHLSRLECRSIHRWIYSTCSAASCPDPLGIPDARRPRKALRYLTIATSNYFSWSILPTSPESREASRQLG